jgi:hypothetical protein
MNGRDGNAYRIFIRKPEGRNHDDLGVDGKIIL